MGDDVIAILTGHPVDETGQILENVKIGKSTTEKLYETTAFFYYYSLIYFTK